MRTTPRRLTPAAIRRLRRQPIDGGIVCLDDGSRVLVRPLRPGDRDSLREGIQSLSPRTRYLRFHGAGPAPSEHELDQLLDLDGEDGSAWCAVDPGAGCGLGVARYVRQSDRPAFAEIALTVIDRWQGRGLGRILLDRLARSAEAAGIERFCAIVLAENREVRGWASARGAAETRLSADEVEIALPVQACRLGPASARS